MNLTEEHQFATERVLAEFDSRVTRWKKALRRAEEIITSLSVCSDEQAMTSLRRSERSRRNNDTLEEYERWCEGQALWIAFCEEDNEG